MRSLTRIEWGVILSIVVVTLAFAWARNHPSTDNDSIRLDIGTAEQILRCPGEDEVIVIIERDSYNLHEGDLHCVHIDVLGGT